MSMLNKKTIEDINVTGKRVLVRCDFNVPLQNGVITDENRLVGALPTIKYLIEKGAKVILCSHLGKPKGEPKPELSLAPVAKRLSEMLGQEVVFAADDNVVGENAKSAVPNMKDGDVSDPIAYGKDFYILKLEKIFNPAIDKVETPSRKEVKNFLENT